MPPIIIARYITKRTFRSEQRVTIGISGKEESWEGRRRPMGHGSRSPATESKSSPDLQKQRMRRCPVICPRLWWTSANGWINVLNVDKKVIIGQSVYLQPQLLRSLELTQNEALVKLDTKPLKSQSRDPCHKSWPSKADFTWLIVIRHKVCLCFTLCSQLTHSSHMTRSWVSSSCYDWLMFLWLTIVSHNHVMTFAHDSHYESRVPRRWRALRTWHVLWFAIGLKACCAVTHWGHLMDFGHDSLWVIGPRDSSY